MKKLAENHKSILSRVIETGLKIWIREKCNHIKKLDLEIIGSNLELLSGQISKIKVSAAQINFQDLELDKAEIFSHQINILINPIKRNINLNKEFTVEGTISINSKNIRNILFASKWLWLSEFISIKLLGLSNLNSLKIENNKLNINSYLSHDKKTLRSSSCEISAKDGKLIIADSSENKIVYIPIDKNIKVLEASIKNNILIIKGEGIVTP